MAHGSMLDAHGSKRMVMKTRPRGPPGLGSQSPSPGRLTYELLAMSPKNMFERDPRKDNARLLQWWSWTMHIEVSKCLQNVQDLSLPEHCSGLSGDKKTFQDLQRVPEEPVLMTTPYFANDVLDFLRDSKGSIHMSISWDNKNREKWRGLHLCGQVVTK